MAFVYFINITASMLLLFWPMWFARTQLRLRWLNPISIVLMVALPVELMKLYIGPLFLIEGGLFDVGYQYAILMANLLSVTTALGALFFFRFSKSMRAHRYLHFKKCHFSGEICDS